MGQGTKSTERKEVNELKIIWEILVACIFLYGMVEFLIKEIRR